MTAALTPLPVLGVPLDSSALKGLASLLATVQMPGGVPVATFGIGKAGAKNGCAVAAIIISSVLMVIGIIIAVVLIAALGPLIAACGELGPGVWELTDGTVITCG